VAAAKIYDRKVGVERFRTRVVALRRIPVAVHAVQFAAPEVKPCIARMGGDLRGRRPQLHVELGVGLDEADGEHEDKPR